jgi:hypothetical protein
VFCSLRRKMFQNVYTLKSGNQCCQRLPCFEILLRYSSICASEDTSSELNYAFFHPEFGYNEVSWMQSSASQYSTSQTHHTRICFYDHITIFSINRKISL